MQPGDLVPTFTGLASLAGQIEDFDSATLNGIYTVLVFYEVPSPNPLLIILHILVILIIVHVQGDFQPVSASFLRALASSLEGKECHIVAISTDSIEAHRFTQCRMFSNPSYLVFHFSEFAATSLKGLSIPLVEDKTGEISRAFGVFDPTKIIVRDKMRRSIKESLAYMGYHMACFFVYMWQLVSLLSPESDGSRPVPISEVPW